MNYEGLRKYRDLFSEGIEPGLPRSAQSPALLVGEASPSNGLPCFGLPHQPRGSLCHNRDKVAVAGRGGAWPGGGSPD